VSSERERVLIAGAGPVGLVAAACLVREGIPVTVLESGSDLANESRASTFHPPTLDMLDRIGAAKPLIAQGLIAPNLQYRSKRDGVIAQFDFGEIADLTGHPYRLQAEQFKLTRILLEQLEKLPNFSIEFDTALEGVEQDGDFVHANIWRGDSVATRSARWLIGADGARSAARRALNIEFNGFTWPERFLVVTTPFDYRAVLQDLAPVSYVADPVCWHFLLKVGDVWRVMFPIRPEVSDEDAVAPEFAQAMLSTVVNGVDRYDVSHITLYRVHQRVAETFRKGRAFLVGDAAHINNPLGGMGMNGGIHDAVNLTERLAAVWRGTAPESDLDIYDLQRRQVTLEYVQNQTIQNKRDLEAADEQARNEFRDRLRRVQSEPESRRAYLQRISMIASLKRAAELA
jgi:3-(3-hydroxy-phenyl)propionate hydroxylase